VTKSEIRDANEGDVLDLVDMGQNFFEESGLSDVAAWDAGSFEATIWTLLSGQVSGSLLVAEQETILVGMTGAVIFPLYCNLKLNLAQEIFWYIDPDYRTGLGGALLDELEVDCRRKGANIFMSAQIAGQRDEAFARLYQRRGYRPSENLYIRKLSS
jgi:GNAT superfamily N-acetyltransferase